MKLPSLCLLSFFALGCLSLSGTQVINSIALAESAFIPDLAKLSSDTRSGNYIRASESSPLPFVELLYREQFPLQLLQTGKFHGDEIQAQAGERWLGLFVTPNGFELLPTTITVNSIYDPILDTNQAEMTGKEVSTDQPHRAVFLLKGEQNFIAGPVQTVFHGLAQLKPFSSKEHDTIHLNFGFSDVSTHDNRYSISLEKFEDTKNARFTLSLFASGSQVSQHIQLFERCCDATYPTLLWAGDLDRDSKLDLLINATNHYNVTHPMLFLSSEAEEGRLVKPVAEFRSVGC